VSRSAHAEMEALEARPTTGYPESRRKSLCTNARYFHAKWWPEWVGDSYNVFQHAGLGKAAAAGAQQRYAA